jgi:PAS domain S-box-containing protein
VYATLLSAILAVYFLIQPIRSLANADGGDMVRLILFCGVGVIVSLITRRLQDSDETILAAAAVVESSADSIMRQSLDGTILSWNKAAERTYGYTAQEAVGRPVSLLVPPDRREELQGLLERVHYGGSVQGIETVRIRKDGRQIDVALTLSPVHDQRGGSWASPASLGRLPSTSTLIKHCGSPTPNWRGRRTN